MYSFRNDYSEGAHPAVLQALIDTNLVQTCGYGLDSYCMKAADLIRDLCEAPEADVHFLVGGTQTNTIVIASLLQPYEAVISAHTGHINVHETGAIEATGHKVCGVFSPDGKLTPELVESVVKEHSSSNVEHMVLPRLVYISDTTEIGSLYTKAELTALRECCDKYGLLLFVDGARLASALVSPENDVTLPDLARLTDVFYIGGTKNGILFGEAVVLRTRHEHFRWHIKQRGAMLAKGRLLGVQFQTLMENGLYFENARHANELAFRLRDGIAALGYEFSIESPSNQQFPIFPNSVVEQLWAKGYEFETGFVPVPDGYTSVRLIASWATPASAIDEFLKDLAACK